MSIIRNIYILVVSSLMKLMMNIVKKIIRMDIIGFDGVGDSGIIALWHEGIFMAGYANPFKHVAVLATKGLRGEILSKSIEQFNPKIIRTSFGKDPKSGAYATLQLIRAAEEGYNLVIAVDGPKGPRRQVKPGIFYLSEKTGKKIVPISIVASRKITLPFRWDKYFIPLPFSHVVIYADTDYKNDGNPESLKKALLKAEETAKKLL